MTEMEPSKTAFVFPGQGAQEVGMGKALAQSHESIAALYERANAIVGYDLAGLCFEGPQEKLDSTEFSQPALYVTSAACLQAFRSGLLASEHAGVTPDYCAGLSLGEYTALYAAGALSFEDGLRLVQLRGRAMQQAAGRHPGGMVSILGMDEPAVRALCSAACEQADEASTMLEPVNFNCPGQIVISGTLGACQKAAELAQSHGAIKAIPLRVAGAFHTPMMSDAADELRSALEGTNFSKFDVNVMANVSGRPYDRDCPNYTATLLAQLTQAVRWQQCVEYLLTEGLETFLEIGSGRVLTGLIKKTARQTRQKANMVNING